MSESETAETEISIGDFEAYISNPIFKRLDIVQQKETALDAIHSMPVDIRLHAVHIAVNNNVFSHEDIPPVVHEVMGDVDDAHHQLAVRKMTISALSPEDRVNAFQELLLMDINPIDKIDILTKGIDGLPDEKRLSAFAKILSSNAFKEWNSGEKLIFIEAVSSALSEDDQELIVKAYQKSWSDYLQSDHSEVELGKRNSLSLAFLDAGNNSMAILKRFSRYLENAASDHQRKLFVTTWQRLSDGFSEACQRGATFLEQLKPTSSSVSHSR